MPESVMNRAPSTGEVVDGAGRILQLIRGGGPQTVSGLASTMGMARSTVNQRLRLLADLGLVATQTPSSGSRGRPATAWGFDQTSAYVLAVHLGFSGYRAAITDLAGTVLARHFIEVDLPAGPDRLLDQVESSLDQLRTEAAVDSTSLAGIGVAAPRPVELHSYLRSLGINRVAWDRDHFHQVLTARHQVPVRLDTDVNLLAIAERRKSWPDAEVFVCTKLGTMIDAAVLVNGTPVHGASDMAGQLAHVKVSGSSALCTCGSTGCLDATASGAALVRQLQERGHQVEHVSDIVALATTGDADAVHAVRGAGRQIGEALATVTNLLNPDAIAVWGYLADAETILFSGIREGLYKGALPAAGDGLSLTTAALGDLAGVLGAAHLVIADLLEPENVDRTIVEGHWTIASPAAE